jgi:uncharacterized protein
MLTERLAKPGPKRLLALDGGGIRGVLTLGYLAKIETTLRERHGNPKLVLSDYFDLIGGTSTGSIIAAMLSLGSSVEDIQSLYLHLGREAFQLRKNWLSGLGRMLGSRFDEKPLAHLLQKHLGERTLSSPDFKTGLVIVAKRADTGSVWKLVNIPTQKYFDYNKDLKLWEIVRASTAAPSYFRPHVVSDVGAGESALFVDGGVSMHANPALAMLMVATLKGFGLDWPIGEENLLLCSVGTGSGIKLSSIETLNRDRNLEVLPRVISQLMYDASEFNETLLQWFSRSPTARVIDSQIGTLQDDWLTPQPILTYLRYDTELSEKSLATIGMNVSETEAELLRDMGNTSNIEKLATIGKAAAVTVKDDHFPKAFDL